MEKEMLTRSRNKRQQASLTDRRDSSNVQEDRTFMTIPPYQEQQPFTMEDMAIAGRQRDITEKTTTMLQVNNLSPKYRLTDYKKIDLKKEEIIYKLATVTLHKKITNNYLRK